MRGVIAISEFSYFSKKFPNFLEFFGIFSEFFGPKKVKKMHFFDKWDPLKSVQPTDHAKRRDSAAIRGRGMQIAAGRARPAAGHRRRQQQPRHCRAVRLTRGSQARVRSGLRVRFSPTRGGSRAAWVRPRRGRGCGLGTAAGARCHNARARQHFHAAGGAVAAGRPVRPVCRTDHSEAQFRLEKSKFEVFGVPGHVFRRSGLNFDTFRAFQGSYTQD
ncbi:hypothetical protein KFK09_016017 [Dendrobium nobile]|uniref:Uncharacterized protein n=1 Tax=Dendrobium nobile TaxID=94219 RepID=A0A8T3B6B8_DENNO|nr:hypothetical protein KFK09_016017 [Dendrobium nobile]